MTVPEGRVARGLNRRQMIKASAAAGVAVWTAPVIIDSLASPAAAATLPVGCRFVTFNSSCSLDSSGNPCTPVAGCTFNSLLTACFTINCANPDGSVDVTNTACLSPNCSITAAQAKSGSLCIPPDGWTGPMTPPPGIITTVHWPPRISPGYSQYAVFITCT